MSGPSIFVENLNLAYEGNTILEGVTTEFHSGECHVIMGPMVEAKLLWFAPSWD
ncbi:hypothetical protein JCM19235_6032 [Vibrio maritimus]|uniref:ABC transporter ATP-binding protein n=1 Tax=Vibrio maritimus TaxID=990268 RepID=A0A090RSJ3_9VIBR|nr:hypothetical protein JCM19235_6032 [Vibrio maritimus]